MYEIASIDNCEDQNHWISTGPKCYVKKKWTMVGPLCQSEPELLLLEIIFNWNKTFSLILILLFVQAIFLI